MKQKFLFSLRAVTMLLVMCLSIGNVWGGTYTIDFNKGTTNGTNISGTIPQAPTLCKSGSDNISDISSENCYYYASGCGIRLAKSKGDGSITFTLSSTIQKEKIKEVIVYASAVASGNTITVTPDGTVTSATTFNNLQVYSSNTSSEYKQEAIAINGSLTSLTFSASAKAYVHLHQIDIVTVSGKYAVDYDLDGGSHGPTYPDSAAIGSAFAVSAPTKAGNTFKGWTVITDDYTNAKWGTTNTPSSEVTSSTLCENGAAGDVYFKDLSTVAKDVVILTANWEASAAASIVSDPTLWDFGTVATGSAATAKIFTITGANLSSAIVASLSQNTPFEITAQSLTSTGGTVSVRPNTTSAGQKEGKLILTSGTTVKEVDLSALVKDKYTITWLVAGNAASGSPTTEVWVGDGITALPTTPVKSDCNGQKEFIGWIKGELASQDTKPDGTFTTAAGAPVITENTTFRAVFAKPSKSSTEYTKGTLADLQTGTRVLILSNPNSGKALSSEQGSSSGYLKIESVTINNGTISNPKDAIVWNVTKNESKYIFDQGSSKILNIVSGGDMFANATSDEWTINQSSNSYRMKSTNASSYYFDYYSASGFKGYVTSANSNLVDFYIPVVSYSAYSTTCEAALWSVTYNKNTSDEITGSLPVTESFTTGTQVALAVANITRTGYICIGWNTDKSATTALEGPITINNADVILYAVWSAKSYDVVFNKDDEAATSTMENQSIKYNESANLKANSFSLAHKSFQGWATESKGSVVYANEASYTMNTEGANLYAVWAWNKTTVTLNKDGGSGGNSQVTATYGSAMPSAGNVPTKTGYTFNGYWTEQNGQGTKYYNADNTSAKNWDLDDATKTLYAAWTPKTVTITLDKGTFGKANGSTQVTYLTTTLIEPTFVEPIENCGYEVEGYYTTSSGGSKVINADGTLGSQLNNWIDNQGRWIKTSDATLYAHYTPINYNVTWVANDKSWDGKGGSATAAYDAKIATVPTILPESSDCDSNKVFVGWTTEEILYPTDTKPTVLFTTAANAPTITGDVTYYAVFAKNIGTSESSYTIAFANSASSATGITTSTQATTFIAEASRQYVTTQPASSITKVYYGDNASSIRIGTSGNAGTITFALSEDKGQVNASKITVNTKLYSSTKAATLSVNSSIAQDIPATAGDLVYNLDGSKLTSITLSTSQYAYIHNITVTSGGAVYSQYVTTCCQPLDAPTGIATTDATTATSITFSWNEVTDATGYQYKVGDGAWSAIQTSRTATIGDLTAGTTIAVKVRATYSGEGDYCAEGEESDAVNLTSLYSITASVNDDKFGTASVSLDGTNWSSSVAAAPETTIYVKAEKKTGYGFSIWSVDDGGAGSFTAETEATTTFITGAANTTIKATFLADEKVLDYITITSAPTKTEYLQGETFSTDGLVVTATYEDKSSSPIALVDLEFNPSLSTPLSPSNEKVVISYTFEAVTKTADQTITVTPVHTVQWLVNGSAHKTLNNVVDGTAYNDLEQPTTPADNALASCDANKFLGWATAEIDGVDPAGTLVQWLQPATTTITADRTFYAVYATRVVGDGTKTTAMADISTGATYYIGATKGEDDYYLVDYSGEGSKNRGSTQDKAKAGLFKLEGSGSTWAIKNANYIYYVALNSTSGATVNASTKSDYSVSNETNAMKFVMNNRQLCLNGSATANFGSYADDYNNAKYIWLEAYETITDYLTTCKDVKEIAVQTAPTKTEYTEEDQLDLTGLKVRVTFEDDTYTDITTGFATSPENGAVLKDETEVVISYKEKQCTQAITVTPLPRANIAATAPATGCSYTVQVGSEVAQTITSATNIEEVIVGRTITLTTTAGDDYVVHSTPFVVTDADEAEVKVSKSGDNYTFTMPNKNVTITAQYVRAYKITAATSLTGGSVVADKAKASKGTKVTVTPTASAGYTIGEVYYTKDGEEGQPHYAITLTDEAYSFNMVENNVTISAVFAPKPVTSITLSATNLDADLNATAPTISATGYTPDDLIDSQKGVTWSIDNTNVAIINESTGVIELKGTGTATITATSISTSGITQTCGLNVYQWNDDDPKYTMSKEGATTGLSDINTFQKSDWGVDANYVRSDQPATKKAEAVDSWKAYIGATEISDGYTYQVADNGQTLSFKVGETTVKYYTLAVGAEPKDTFVVNIFEVQGIEDFYTKSYTAPVIDNQDAGTEASCQDHNIFVGWVLEENRGNLTEDNIVAGGTEMTAGNHTYYAVWGKKENKEINKTIHYGWESSEPTASSWLVNNNLNKNNTDVSAKEGSKYAVYGGTQYFIQTVTAIAKPVRMTAYVTKVSNNSNSDHKFIIKGSSSSSGPFTDIASVAMTGFNKGEWQLLQADLSADSYKNKYFQIYLDEGKGTVQRALDDVTLTYKVTEEVCTDYITDCETRHELSFNNNDGEGDAYETIKLANGIQTTLPDGDQLSKYLNTFTGWNTNAAGTGTHYDPSDTFTMGEADVELFAEWTPCAVTSIVLTTTDVQTTFGVDEKFNANHLKVKAIYGDCDVEVENVAGWTTNFDNVTFTDSHLGAQTVEVTFGGQTETYGITVVPSKQVSYYVNGVKVEQRSAFNNKVGEMPNAMAYWDYARRYPVFAGWILTDEIGQNPTFITETTVINEDCNAYAVFAAGYTLGDVAAEPTTSANFDGSKRYVIKATVSEVNKYYNGKSNTTISPKNWGLVSENKDEAMPITILGSACSAGVLQATGEYFLAAKGGDNHEFHLTDNKVTAFSVEADGTLKCTATNEYLCYGSSTGLRWYSSSSTKAYLYEVPVTYNNMVLIAPAEEKDITESGDISAEDVDPKTNLVIKENTEITLTSAVVINDLTIDDGATFTMQGENTITANSLIISTSLADKNQDGEGTAAKSAQIRNAGTKISAENVYIETKLTPSGVAEFGWYAFAVPFEVELNGGVYGKLQGQDWAVLTNEVDFAVMQYQGDVRAQGKYGWVKVQKKTNKLVPGVFYLVTVADTDFGTLRFKKAEGAAINNAISEMPLNQFASSESTDAGWNGVANPALTYNNAAHTNGEKALVYYHGTNSFNTIDFEGTSFVVGSPFFVQAIGSNDKITLTATTTPGELRAPARDQVSGGEFNVRLGKNTTTYVDQIYLSATENAKNEYQIGHDMVKSYMGTPKVAQMYINGYNFQLCDAEFPLMNDQAEFPIELTAPVAGEYELYVNKAPKDATLYLCKDGHIVWNLSLGAYEIELQKGTTTGYSLRLVQGRQTTTDVKEVYSTEDGTQKFIYRDKLIIIHDGKVYDGTGAVVK